MSGYYDSVEASIRYNLNKAKECEESAKILQARVDKIKEVSKYYRGDYERANKQARREHEKKNIGSAALCIVVAIICFIILMFLTEVDSLESIANELGPLVIPIGIIQAIKKLTASNGYVEPWGKKDKQWKNYLKENPDIAASAYDYYINEKSLEPLLKKIEQARDDSYRYRREAGINIDDPLSLILERVNNGFTLNEARKDVYQERKRIQAQYEENRRRLENGYDNGQNINDKIDDLRSAIEESDRNAEARYHDYVYRKKIDDMMKNSK